VRFTNSAADSDGFLRELHHRVKNNFQIIASLVNLQKRMLPADRRGEARFVEEHVQSMAAAYRIVTVSDGIVQVALDDLVSDVVDTLRQIADVAREGVALELPRAHCFIRIDQAVAMGLYLAVLVPPYLDAAAAVGGVARITVVVDDPGAVDDPGYATVSISIDKEARIATDPLRRRLTAAYLRQLFAELDPTANDGATRVKIQLQPLQAAIAVGQSEAVGQSGAMGQSELN
jgi:hypothetical protein